MVCKLLEGESEKLVDRVAEIDAECVCEDTQNAEELMESWFEGIQLEYLLVEA